MRMRWKKRGTGLLATGALGLCFLGSADPALAHANWRVNGFGWGSCGAGVVAAAGGAASGVAFTGFNSECCVPAGVYVPCSNTAPLPGGANAGSFAGSWYRGPWRGAWRAASAGGDGWGTTTAPGPGCDGASNADFQLNVTGDVYTLSGSWSNSDPMATGSVCVECGGVTMQCVSGSGFWSAPGISLSGVLCPAQPVPGQTADQWYQENVYLTGVLDAPANPQCVVAVTKLP